MDKWAVYIKCKVNFNGLEMGKEDSVLAFSSFKPLFPTLHWEPVATKTLDACLHLILFYPADFINGTVKVYRSKDHCRRFLNQAAFLSQEIPLKSQDVNCDLG